MPSIVICPFITYTCADPGNFVRGVHIRRPKNTMFFFVFLVLNLFYSLQRGSNGFNTDQGSKGGSNILQGGPTYYRGGVQQFPGGPTFSRGRGPNPNFYRNPYNLCFSRGGGVRTPYLPSGSAHDQVEWLNLLMHALCFCYCLLTFFSNIFRFYSLSFQKYLSGTHSECKTVWICRS